MTASFIDGFVAPVADANREAYRAHAAKFGAVFRRHGALRMVECWGADVPEGVLTSFPLAVKRAEGESVIFSWIEWPSKEVRDAAWDAIMADETLQPEMSAMPFDGKRMIYGGFSVLLDV